ncbi:hypothetical protein MO973_18035 [Paenibacillus sp. TRM 82003]|nr:hypothetical protein [Paenibacillus sp. TRM 82003]
MPGADGVLLRVAGGTVGTAPSAAQEKASAPVTATTRRTRTPLGRSSRLDRSAPGAPSERHLPGLLGARGDVGYHHGMTPVIPTGDPAGPRM